MECTRGDYYIYIYIYTHIRAAGFVHFLSFGNLASLGGPRLLGGWGCVWNAHRRGPVYTNIRTAGLMAFVRLASFGGPRIYTCMECTGGDYIYIYIYTNIRTAILVHFVNFAGFAARAQEHSARENSIKLEQEPLEHSRSLFEHASEPQRRSKSLRKPCF